MASNMDQDVFLTHNKMYCGHCSELLGNNMQEIIHTNVCSIHKCLQSSPQVKLIGNKISCYQESASEVLLEESNKVHEQPSTSFATTDTSQAQWSVGMTHCLIEAYNKHKDKFRSAMYNKKQVWEKISEEIAKSGVHKSGQKCDEKWRNLKKMYDKILSDQKSTGAAKVYWTFYEEFKDIYHKDPHYDPVQTASSSGSLKHKDENSLSTQYEGCTPKKRKLSPGEDTRKRTLSSYELEERRQKRHEERMAQKREIFNWFKTNFGNKEESSSKGD